MRRTSFPLLPACLALVAALATAPVHAQGNAKSQYISDDISVSIRDRASNDAGSIGVIKSGARVTVLEVLGADSFARIKTADGREGWITSRFLSNEPAAKDQLLPVRKELADANMQIQTLQRELDQTRQALEKAAPALQLAGDNEKLRATMAESERAVSDLRDRYDEESARRKTLILGAGLVGGGVLLGLVLPLLARSRRRRYSSF